ncbi:MAG: hypothetical protein ACRD0Z_14050 [Acidimicrobiales bacterium]
MKGGETEVIERVVEEPTSGSDTISCPTPNDCFAVGTYSSPKDSPFAEHWSGTRWSLMSIPDPEGVNEDLNALYCPSAHQCVAVGDWYVSLSQHTFPFTEVWDGASWRRVAAAGTGQELTGVSCPAANDCLAVGG